MVTFDLYLTFGLQCCRMYSSMTRCCATDSSYHVMSTAASPCTVSANVSSTLAFVCSTQVTSTEVDDVVKRSCAVRWQRLSTSGRYSNVTSSSSGKYSMWKMERPASDGNDDDDDDGDGGGDEDSTEVVNVLQINALQPDHFTRSPMTS